METHKLLNQLENEWELYDRYLSIQNDPYRFNALIVIVIRNMELLEALSKDLANNGSEEMKQRASNLTRRYNNLRAKYFQNHPWRPFNSHN